MAKEDSYKPFFLFTAGAIVGAVCSALTLRYYYTKVYKDEPASKNHSAEEIHDLEEESTKEHHHPIILESSATHHKKEDQPSFSAVNFSQNNIAFNVIPMQPQGLDMQQLLHQELANHKEHTRLLLAQSSLQVDSKIKKAQEELQERILELEQLLNKFQFTDQAQKAAIFKYIFDTNLEQCDIIANIKGLTEDLSSAKQEQILGLLQQEVASDAALRLESIGLSEKEAELVGCIAVDVQQFQI